jgi:hypothetical protein
MKETFSNIILLIGISIVNIGILLVYPSLERQPLLFIQLQFTMSLSKSRSSSRKAHPFVEYATRLGYTSRDANLAISRLGHNATFNDLLQVVISLKSDSSAQRNDLPDKWQSVPKPRQR